MYQCMKTNFEDLRTNIESRQFDSSAYNSNSGGLHVDSEVLKFSVVRNRIEKFQRTNHLDMARLFAISEDPSILKLTHEVTLKIVGTWELCKNRVLHILGNSRTGLYDDQFIP